MGHIRGRIVAGRVGLRRRDRPGGAADLPIAAHGQRLRIYRRIGVAFRAATVSTGLLGHRLEVPTGRKRQTNKSVTTTTTTPIPVWTNLVCLACPRPKYRICTRVAWAKHLPILRHRRSLDSERRPRPDGRARSRPPLFGPDRFSPTPGDRRHVGLAHPQWLLLANEQRREPDVPGCF